jgi:hypothetical protein
MKAQEPHDPIVSDLGRTRSITQQKHGELNQRVGLSYNEKQQYYNGFPRKAEAHTHQMNVTRKQGWQEQDTMPMLRAPEVHFRNTNILHPGGACGRRQELEAVRTPGRATFIT